MLYFLTVNYHSTELLKDLLGSLPRSSAVPYQVAIVNNSPEDGDVEALAGPNVTVLSAGENLGFGCGCNLGLQWIYDRDPAAIVWLVNPDSQLLPETSLDRLLDYCDRYTEISILGTTIYTPDRKIWFAGGSFDPRSGAIAETPVACLQSGEPVACDWVSGCSIVLNLKNFSECPRFDPAFFLYYEDFDFCQRYHQQGHKVAVTAAFGLIHAPSSITNRQPFGKLNHSTFSYLLVLGRYASWRSRLWRLGRVVLVALGLLAIAPGASFGKLYGVARFLGQGFESSRGSSSE